jgi:hypothetical protein
MSAATVDLSPVYAGVLTIRADNTGDRNGPDRRTRAAAINGAKRKFERENNVTLTLKSKRYDEAYDFTHRTEIFYLVTYL